MSAHEGGSMYECFKLHLGHGLSLEPYLRPSIPGINLVCEKCNRAIAFEQPPDELPDDGSMIDPLDSKYHKHDGTCCIYSVRAEHIHTDKCCAYSVKVEPR